MTPESVLKEYWGYTAFRPLQRDIIQSVLEGRDTLALLPTGGGKSLCFQVPALCTEGVCLVVSPLIALMKDQVANLKKRGIAAAAIFSGMHPKDIDRLFDNAVYGGLKFLYVSPERLATPLAQARLPRMNINLIAVDEAHCISQWGYDFRPSYLKIADLRQLLPKVPIIALTATATPDVVVDIKEKLLFGPSHGFFEQDFTRHNLAYVVRETDNKMQKMLDVLQNVGGSSVVYVRNRKKTREIALFLRSKGISADYYHAGLSHDERSQKQDAWIQDATRVIVATNAFGMGIDKPDVRSVIHLDLPESLEAYFQEAGRAGRDGEKAFAVLLYHATDADALRRQFEQAFPDFKMLKQVYGAVGSFYQLATGAGLGQSFDFDLAALAQRYQLDPLMVHACLKVLEQDGWLTLSDGVYLPASVQILVDRTQLYDYQLRRQSHDWVIKGLLRAFPGILSHSVTFNVLSLAKALRMLPSDLEKALMEMHADEILMFQPAKEKPQLTFLRERVDNDRLDIDWALFNFRKKRAAFRLNKTIEYAALPVCRAVQLVKYLGQNRAEPCGVCDVCLQRKPDADTEGVDVLKRKITALLRQEPLLLREILEAFATTPTAQVVQALGFLLNEGHIAQENDTFVVKK